MFFHIFKCISLKHNSFNEHNLKFQYLDFSKYLNIDLCNLSKPK